MINRSSITIALVAGESSGDMLGAGLIKAIKKRVPNARFIGVAGPLMQREGCEALYNMEELEVMGIIEVFFHLRRLLCIRKDLTRRFITLRPDVFVSIDSPDFNISLSYNLKKQGIKTIHYVSPSIWAWRRKRVIKIKKSTHLMLSFLPFEKEFYDKYNVPCRFIGHTIADSMPLNPDKNMARNVLDIPRNSRCLALLPGSRASEVEMLSPDFLRAIQIIRHFYPDLEIIVPLINSRCREKFEKIRDRVTPELNVRIFNRKSQEAMMASDVALVASGTATLECMLAKCPMVVGYRMRPFTFWIVSRLITTEYISLPNLLAGRKLVKEFLQKECQPRILAEALLSLLNNDTQEITNTFHELHQRIRCNADEQAADSVLELIR